MKNMKFGPSKRTRVDEYQYHTSRLRFELDYDNFIPFHTMQMKEPDLRIYGNENNDNQCQQAIFRGARRRASMYHILVVFSSHLIQVVDKC